MTVPSEESDHESLTSGFARALGVPAGEEIRRYVTTGQGGLPAGATLLAWDANSVHGYVFDTTNATCIRGASTRLREVDATLRRGRYLELAPEQILYAGGGSGMAVLSAANAEATEAHLHEIFAEKTRIATCTTAAIPLLHEKEGFQGRVQEVFRALARNRFLTGSDAEASVPFFALRCAVCGHRAAAESVSRVAVPEGRPECEVCRERIETGRASRRDGNEPSDFQDLSDRSEGGSYAVVYSDGNGVGRLLGQLKSPLEYMRVSREIDRLLGTTVRDLAKRYDLTGDDEEAGEDHPRPNRGRPPGRYQLPICGGDDVVAILPGEVALPFARDLVRALQAGADASPVLGGATLGACAGVAISNVKFPIRHLLTEAEGLLKLAKRRVYADRVRSSLSFSVITDGSPRAESVTPERWARAATETLLSGRPYSLEDLETFSRRIRVLRKALSDLGKSQLYILLRHAHAGPAQLRSHVLYQIGRREEWRRLIQDLSGRDAGILTDPSACVEAVIPEYSGRKVFDVADMLDVFDHWREPEEEREP